MKSKLKYAFNILRNISLFFVVGILIMFYYKPGNNFLTKIIFQQSEENNLESNLDQKEDDFQIQEVNNFYKEVKKSLRFKIPIKNGTTYLNSSEIIYIYKSDSLILMTIDNQIVLPSQNLKKLYETLSKSETDCFFRINNAILNCNYIRKVTRENFYFEGYKYRYFAEMIDRKKIKISEDKYKKLNALLNQMVF